jgi:hypothetical protein
MNVIFTDIDGVFNTINRNQWSSLSVALYDDLCQEFNLKPVITSTWRVKHSIKELERIFQHYGIFTDIYDFTPIINSEGRGGRNKRNNPEKQF